MNEWGWNPASFEAIGTVLAAAIAVLALWTTRRQALEQAKREVAALEAELKRDARLIWVSLEYARGGPDGAMRCSLRVGNRSQSAIHRIHVRIHSTHPRRSRPEILLAPETMGWTSHWDTFGQLLTGRVRTTWNVASSWFPESLPPGEALERTIDISEEGTDPLVTVSYTDSRRSRWLCGSDGSLRLIMEDTPLRPPPLPER